MQTALMHFIEDKAKEEHYYESLSHLDIFVINPEPVNLSIKQIVILDFIVSFYVYFRIK